MSETTKSAISARSSRTWISGASSSRNQNADEFANNTKSLSLAEHATTLFSILSVAMFIIFTLGIVRSAVVLSTVYSEYETVQSSDAQIEIFRAVGSLQEIVLQESFARLKYLTSGLDAQYYAEMSDAVSEIDKLFTEKASEFKRSSFAVAEYRQYNCSFYQINSNLNSRANAVPVNQHRSLDERNLNAFDDMDFYNCLTEMLADYQAQLMYTSQGFGSIWNGVYAYVSSQRSLLSYQIALNYAFLTKEMVLNKGLAQFTRATDASRLEQSMALADLLLTRAYEIAFYGVGMSSIPAMAAINQLVNELASIRNATKAYRLATPGDKFELTSTAKSGLTYLTAARNEFEIDMLLLQETATDNALEQMIAEGNKLFIFIILLPLLAMQSIRHSWKESQRLENRYETTVDRYADSFKAIFRLLPAPVAKTLNTGGNVKPEYFHNVTVFYSDIVGFTGICAQLTASEVINMLNRIYTLFDSRMAAYKCYKIETIGDAYVVASGVPLRIESHAAEITSLALVLVEEVAMIKIPGKKGKVRVRIGINSGPVIAGVVGVKMLRYCIFGKTVLTANRMEQTSLPQRIQVSHTTFTELDNYGGFVMEKRKKSEWPTEDPTYWVIGRVTGGMPLSMFSTVDSKSGRMHVRLPEE